VKVAIALQTGTDLVQPFSPLKKSGMTCHGQTKPITIKYEGGYLNCRPQMLRDSTVDQREKLLYDWLQLPGAAPGNRGKPGGGAQRSRG